VGRQDLLRIFIAFREKCPTDELDGEFIGINDLQSVVCNMIAYILVSFRFL
jgi:hypothetical protein